MGNNNIKQTAPTEFKKPNGSINETSYYNRDAKEFFTKMKSRFDNAIVPLKSVTVDAKIVDVCAEISVTHLYRHANTNPLEAIFEFSLSSDEATVCGLVVEVAGKKVVGKVKEKQQAFNTYDDAIASGHGGYLVESNKKGQYTLSVGQLPPNQDVKVTLTIVSQLVTLRREAGENLLFVLPNTLFPLHKYDLDINVSIQMTGGVKDLFCNVPGAVITSKDQGTDIDCTIMTLAGATVTAKSPEFNFFYLTFALNVPFVPTALIEKDDKTGSYALMLTYYPSWESFDKDLFVPSSEIIFVVDRSGSMAGARMKAVQSTMQLFLRSLPEGTKFNIVGFGSSVQWLFDYGSLPYNDANLQKASKHVDQMKADLGGTELLPPLRAIFSKTYDEDFPRQLFVLTDGEVDNTLEVIEATAREADTTRVFSLGIGDGASQELVKGIAKAAKGEAEFIRSTTEERMEAKVIAQLERALEPSLKKVRVNWGDLQKSVNQSPFLVRPVFNGERLIIYALIEEPKDIPSDAEFEVNLEGIGPDGNLLSYKLTLDFKKATKGTLLHKLAAKDIDNKKSYFQANTEQTQQVLKKASDETIRLGVKYQLATPLTSFVAVEEREDQVAEAMTSVQVPTPKSVEGVKQALGLQLQAAQLDLEQERSNLLGNIKSGTKLKKSVHSPPPPAPSGIRSAPPPPPSSNKDIAAMTARIQNNIEAVLNRADNLDELVDKSDALEAQSRIFSKKSSKKSNSPSFFGKRDAAIASDSVSTVLARRASIEESDDEKGWDDDMEYEESDMKFTAEREETKKKEEESNRKQDEQRRMYEEASRKDQAERERRMKDEKARKEAEEKSKQEVIQEVDLPPRNGFTPLQVSDIVKTQKANGSWLLRHFEWMTSVKISSTPVKHSDTQSADAVGCLRTKILELFFSSMKNEWNLVEQKAIKFIKRTLVSNLQIKEPSKATELLEEAKKFVQSQKLKL